MKAQAEEPALGIVRRAEWCSIMRIPRVSGHAFHEHPATDSSFAGVEDLRR